MKRHSLFLLIALTTLGCKADEAAPLPPASGEGAAPRPALPEVAAKPSTPTTPQVSDKTTGTTYPKDRAEVAPEMSGVIESIAVSEGDTVKKGQVLFRLRSADLALRIKQAETQLAGAKVQEAAVKTEHDRTQRLFEQRAVDQAQWDRIQAQYRSAQIAVEQAQVGLSLARQALGDAVVRAPISGVVTAKLKSAGEAVSMMPPTTVLVIEDQSSLELRFRLPEAALSSVAVGTTVHIRFAATGLSVDKQITRIAPSIDPSTRTVEIVVDLDNANGALRSGMLATVDIGSGAAK